MISADDRAVISDEIARQLRNFGSLMVVAQATPGLYPVLSAEQNVKNAYWPTGDYRRYYVGGITQAAALQSAFDGARLIGSDVVIPGGRYVVDQPLNVTFSNTDTVATRRMVRVRSETGTGIGSSVGLATIVAAHNGPAVFDCSGSYSLIFDGVNLGTSGGFSPQCGWLFARNSLGSSAGAHSLMNCRAFGSFSLAVVYSYGSEVCEFFGCHFYNTAPNPVIFFWTQRNVDYTSGLQRVQSTFITIATGIQSMIKANVWGGEFQAKGAGGSVFVLDCADKIQVRGPWALAADENGADGHSIVRIDLHFGASNNCSFLEIDAENETPFVQTYGCFCTNDVATPVGIRFERCHLPSRTKAIFAGANVTAAQWHIEAITESVQRGIQFGGVLQESYYKTTTPLSVVTSLNNEIHAPYSYLTITQQSGGIIIDQGEGGMVINSSTLLTGTTVGAGGKGVLSMASGVQPAAVPGRGQVVVVGGALKFVGGAGTVTSLAPA